MGQRAGDAVAAVVAILITAAALWAWHRFGTVYTIGEDEHLRDSGLDVLLKAGTALAALGTWAWVAFRVSTGSTLMAQARQERALLRQTRPQPGCGNGDAPTG